MYKNSIICKGWNWLLDIKIVEVPWSVKLDSGLIKYQKNEHFSQITLDLYFLEL